MRTPDSWDTARATVGIALATGLIFLVLSVFELDRWATAWGAFLPSALSESLGFARAPFLLTPLTATLLHGGFFHLLFNLVIFLFCGRATEGALGPTGLIILYVAGAYAAAAGHYVAWSGQDAAMIGASGAISAVIGAYAMLFGKNRVRVRDPKLALWLNVLWLLAAWVVLQTAMAITLHSSSGILLALGAHIGGFIAGVALARPLLLWRYRKA